MGDVPTTPRAWFLHWRPEKDENGHSKRKGRRGFDGWKANFHWKNELLPWVCGETWKQWNCNEQKSRPMKSLRNFQKRKYVTPPTIIGQHATRRELVIAPMRDCIFVGNAEQPESENLHSDDGPNDGASRKTDLVFEIGEVLVFHGTDGLPFNLLKITENVSRESIGPRSKLRGDFLAETSRDEDNIFYAIDPNWTGASMAYAHILLDSDDNAMTVCLDETVTITETTYKISPLFTNSLIQDGERTCILQLRQFVMFFLFAFLLLDFCLSLNISVSILS